MKTFKALFINNGVIKAGEFPVEPTRCDEQPDYPYDYPCHLCQADATAYSVALASAKANALVIGNPEVLEGVLPERMKEAKGRIVPLCPGWDWVVKQRVCLKDCDCNTPCEITKVAILYRTDEQIKLDRLGNTSSPVIQTEESQEVLWNKAEGIIAEAMGTYKTSLTVALASYARKELEKRFTITPTQMNTNKPEQTQLRSAEDITSAIINTISPYVNEWLDSSHDEMVKALNDTVREQFKEGVEEQKEARISELEAENEKNIKWANDAETRAVAAEERIVELEAENKRLREEHRWIPVTGTLPEVLHVRIKLSDGSEINALTQNDGDFYWELLDRFIPEHAVTHFIPQPPKEQ